MNGGKLLSSTGTLNQTRVVDNEYSQSPISHAEYFAQLEAVYHASDIVVPLTYNDPGEGSNFINGTVSSPLHPMIKFTTLSRVPWIYTGNISISGLQPSP